MKAVDPDALRDDPWERIKDLVPGGRRGQRGPRCDNRRFVNALLWMARSGARWRDLPERFGEYEAVKRRYYRWIERGALDGFLEAERGGRSGVGDDRLNPRQSPSARRRCAARQGGAHAQALGRSRGGLSSKIHAATDALGNPLRLLAGPGQENDMARAHELIAGLRADAVIGDRAYDADRLHDAVLETGAASVIPPRRHRRRPHAYDKELYKERNRIERFFNKLKQFRRVATRYDKLLATFLGFVKLAAIAVLLR